MSKFMCTCRNSIGNDSSKESIIISDEDRAIVYEKIEDDILSFVEALKNNILSEWEKPRGKYFENKLPSETFLVDLVSSYVVEASRTMISCSNCKRIWLQVEKGSALYRPYLPEFPS